MAAQMSLRQAGKLLALVALIVLAVRAVLNQPAASAPAPPASHVFGAPGAGRAPPAASATGALSSPARSPAASRAEAAAAARSAAVAEKLRAEQARAVAPAPRTPSKAADPPDTRCAMLAKIRAAKESEIPDFKGSYLGRFPLAKMPALPATLKAEYDALSCDGVLKTLAAALAAADAAAPKADGPLGPRDECRAMMAKHSVAPGSSWGSLGPNGQRRWGSLRCDGLVKGAKNTPSKAAADRARNSRSSTTCCRPVRTVDCGFRYAVVLGYDVGDKFWDLGDGATLARAWFDENVKSVLAAANVEAELRFAVVDNKIKKPGPVFTAITRHAYYEAKADYIYRVNDDTELATRWAHVAALATMDNVGAVGPMCKQGNRKILTHDFTHRKHMDIFEGTYYPPELSDWHAGLLKGLLAGGSKKIQACVAKSNAGIAQPPRGFSRFRAKLRR
ncbi:hypothetical protein JL720_13979 [Aureococcus anophagefferens]|nr:hypothetical protein JL720_13979 [Aureococcus anophagefferens]